MGISAPGCAAELSHLLSQRLLELFQLWPSPWLSCAVVVAETCFLLNRSGFDSSLALQFIERGVVQQSFVHPEPISSVRFPFRWVDNVSASLADVALIRPAEIHDPPLLLTSDHDFKIGCRHGRQMIPFPCQPPAPALDQLPTGAGSARVAAGPPMVSLDSMPAIPRGAVAGPSQVAPSVAARGTAQNLAPPVHRQNVNHFAKDIPLFHSVSSLMRAFWPPDSPHGRDRGSLLQHHP